MDCGSLFSYLENCTFATKASLLPNGSGFSLKGLLDKALSVAENNSPPPVHFGKLHNFSHPPQALDSRASSGVYNEPRRPRQL